MFKLPVIWLKQISFWNNRFDCLDQSVQICIQRKFGYPLQSTLTLQMSAFLQLSIFYVSSYQLLQVLPVTA